MQKRVMASVLRSSSTIRAMARIRGRSCAFGRGFECSALGSAIVDSLKLRRQPAAEQVSRESRRADSSLHLPSVAWLFSAYPIRCQ